MATFSDSKNIPDSFSAHEKFLVQKTEEAIVSGLQLKNWYETKFADGTLSLTQIDIGKPFRLKNQVRVFFDTLPVNGVSTSIMGCVQEGEFTRVEGPNKREKLREFVLKQFLPGAHWTADDGHPGGFGVEQSLYQAADDSYAIFPESNRNTVVDLRDLGPRYRWVLLTVQIHDFIMDFGPIRKRFEEAACVVPNAAFVEVKDDPSPDCELEITTGYPFVEFAPIPNVFGFGPGKFGAAIKLYTFMLMRNGDIRTRMGFMAAPRCEKVFDFGKSIPDPIYGGAALISAVTFGLWKTEAFHRKLDSGMLGQHSRVHQSLMDGVDRVWSSWYRGGVS